MLKNFVGFMIAIMSVAVVVIVAVSYDDKDMRQATNLHVNYRYSNDRFR